MAERILRLPAVVERVGLSKSTIYDMIRRREFPDSIALGTRARGWREADLERWISDRARLTEAGPARH